MTSPPFRIRALTFDLGDTLWHFPHPPPPEAIEEHFASRLRLLLGGWGVDYDVTPDDLQRRIRTTRAEADRAADAGDWVSPDYLAITHEVTRDAGLNLTPGQVSEVWQAMNTGGDFLGRVMFEDTFETLDWLKVQGFRIAALTNRTHGGATFLEEMRQDGLLPYFGAVISSDQAGYRKPHPEIFRITLDALAVQPHEVAHVGDRLDMDIRGARSSGMAAIWMRRVHPPETVPHDPTEEPHATIERLVELRKLPLLHQ